MRKRYVLGGVAVVALVVAAVFLAGPAAQPRGGTGGMPLTLKLPRVPWEGGPAYYEKFAAAKARGWADPAFFPIGVWYESVLTDQDVLTDKEAGLNLYVELTDDSSPRLIDKHGMSAITSKPLPGAGTETVGWLIADEADMFPRPGNAQWDGRLGGAGDPCIPPKGEGCGFTAMKTLKDKLPEGDGRMYYANYGKGVGLWWSDKDNSQFVNGYTDIVSTDMYWYTDAGICVEAKTILKFPDNECPRAADYGWLMDKQRALDAMDGKLQPVYNFVEVGWPFSDQNGTGVRTIKPDELKGAVMSSIIHEARGILYFNHSFGGPCTSQHALREPCYKDVRAAATEVNKQIGQLAPVLNTQSYVFDFGKGLETMLKGHDGSFYVFAMIERGDQPGERSLTLPPELAASGEVEVLFENRTIPVDNGRFTDTFQAEHSYHIYKITP
ncbi:hypothetical protein [Nonomuraea africana]|uniref:Uncharacterized protein n=1 Tax=Nonomuraea africana TaxID=46171 RepID=A0ABR9KSK7_9ACTN|nr:hypothetical protein [Nonomuraea africana]MBE1565021.1 hypothetical protein [Nonomuraea africana]